MYLRGGMDTADIMIFKRYEKKYRITQEKMDALLGVLGERLVPDDHGKNTVCSLYLDTPSFLLIRNSIDAVSYKEKLRIRSYGAPREDKKVFFEIKKKYRGVVYKRRVSMTYGQVLDYIDGGEPPLDSQIMREIDHLMKLYGMPQPSACILCEREAYFVNGDPDVRLTFDGGIRYIRGRFPTCSDIESGEPILPRGEYILEIKTSGAMPVWLARALSELEIYPSRFSKYANAYYDIIKKKEFED